jgi:hypothetical protein
LELQKKITVSQWLHAWLLTTFQLAWCFVYGAQSFNGSFSAGLILALHCWVFLWVNFFQSLVRNACRN